MRLFAKMSGKSMRQSCFTWESGKSISIDPFLITLYLIDHSAFDSYALHIVVDGKHILYSGDFRAQGRKKKLTYALMQHIHKPMDVLIMEGTNLPSVAGNIKPAPTEEDLEKRFYPCVQGNTESRFCQLCFYQYRSNSDIISCLQTG